MLPRRAMQVSAEGGSASGGKTCFASVKKRTALAPSPFMEAPFVRLLGVLLILLSFAGSAFALTVPEKPTAYVNDYAALLSEGARRNLEAVLGQFEKETSNQIVVAIFPSLDGQVLEDFSIKLAEKWKIGTKKNNNGVILLIFKNDRKVRIEVGYGLEGALPDATARMIIQREITPSFRQGDFDGGVTRAVNAMIQATKGEYRVSRMDKEDWAGLREFIFFLMVFYFFAPYVCYIFALIWGSAFWGTTGFFGALVLSTLLEFFRRIFILPRAGRTITSGTRWKEGFGGVFTGGFSGGGFSGGFGGGGGASGGW